ncbi:MAG: N-acetylmuramate alpha-1-phosphate uridylyltransferase MurU [Pseudomonadota bacterium]
MKCLLLSAGRGERLRPLTDKVPKPLVKIAGKAIIEYHLERLKKAGFNEIVINLSHLGNLIEEHLGDGSNYDLKIEYSQEGDHPLETAGGIIHALPKLGDKPFLVMNADIWCDHTLSFAKLSNDKLAHLVLIDNPNHNPKGDFAYEFGKIYTSGKNMLTFSGIGIYHPRLFSSLDIEKRPLAPILRNAIDHQRISAEYFSGNWFDIGTQARLAEVEKFIAKRSG